MCLNVLSPLYYNIRSIWNQVLVVPLRGTAQPLLGIETWAQTCLKVHTSSSNHVLYIGHLTESLHWFKCSLLVRSTRAVVEEKKLWSLDCSHEVQAQQCCQHQGVFGAWSGEHNLFAGVWRKAASLPRRTAGPSITLCTRLHLHLFNPPQPFSHRHLLHQVDHLYLVCHLLEQDVEEEEKHISFLNIAKDMLNSKLALPVKGLFIIRHHLRGRRGSAKRWRAMTW